MGSFYGVMVQINIISNTLSYFELIITPFNKKIRIVAIKRKEKM